MIYGTPFFSQYLPTTGRMTVFFIARSTFSHVSTTSGSIELVETLIVILLMITLTLFLSEFSVSTADVLEPVTLCLVSGGSVDVKVNLLPLVIHTSVFEFPVMQAHVTVSPGHTVSLSQVTEVASTSF